MFNNHSIDNYERLKEKALTNVLPENIRFRFLKRVINKFIKSFTRQQIEFNNIVVTELSETKQALLETKQALSETKQALAETKQNLLEIRLQSEENMKVFEDRHKLVKDMLKNLARRIKIPELESIIDNQSCENKVIADLSALTRKKPLTNLKVS